MPLSINHLYKWSLFTISSSSAFENTTLLSTAPELPSCGYKHPKQFSRPMPRLPSIDLHGHDNGKLNQSRWPQMSGKTFNKDDWCHIALTSSRVYSIKFSRSKSSVMVKWLTFAVSWQSETQEELFCEWYLNNMSNMWSDYDWAWTRIVRRNQLVNSEEDLQSCAHNVCYGSTCIFLHLEYPKFLKKNINIIRNDTWHS